MEQIGSEYNFKTGGSIKALNDLIAKVEELDKQVNKLGGDTQRAGDGLNNLPKKTQGAAKGFDALGNSINQVTREFPAFAFSAQTGFLAVSNNIPILLDSINQLKVANQQLAAEGKATIPVFKQIISSLFSWQTALSLLISFSVLYGKEIGNFIANMFSASDAVDILKLRVDALNKAYDSKELNSNIKGLIDLKKNIDLAQEGYVNKEDVLKSYNEQFGKVLGTTNDINVAEENLVKATPTLIQAYIQRAAGAKIASDAAQTAIDIIKETEKVRLESIKVTNFQLGQLTSQFNKGEIKSLEEFNKRKDEIFERNSVENSIKERINGAGKLADLKKQQENEIKLIGDFNRKAEEVLKGVGIIDDGSKEREAARLKALKEAADKAKELLAKRVQDELNIAQEAYIKEISAKDATNEKKEQAEIRLLEAQRDIFEKYKQFDEKYAQDSLDTREKLAEKKLSIEERAKAEYLKSLKEEYDADNKFMQKTIDDELDAIKEKYATIRENAALSRKEQLILDLKETEETIEKLEVVKEASEKQSDQLVALKKKQGKLVSEINKETNEEILDQEKERLRQQRLLAQEGIQVLGTFSNGFFDLRKSQLEEETNIQLNELEKQKEAKSITEEEFQIKRKQLLTEQAQKQRQYDLAQIRVETALAIMKTFAQFGYPAGIPLALLAAAQGAIQYSFASAQPLPQFAKGTDRVIGGTKGKDSVHALLMPDEAVIPTKENMARPGLAKAWISGNLDSHLMMNYIKPAIEENNKKWEAVLKVNQNSTFIRNDNFNDRRIVRGLDRINRKLSTTNVIKTNRRGLWN